MENAVDFIKLLKSQHKAIITTIYEIDNQAGGPADLKNSREKLNRITDLLFDHLEKEDKQLYPVLLGNKETESLAKKYSYDMERLSCLAIDFFKRYCVNKEGLKVFVEDFINSYSIFGGLLKLRIKREETELYPSYILLQSGVLYSDVLEYVQEKETKGTIQQKQVIVHGENEAYLNALQLTLEMLGLEVFTTKHLDKVDYLVETSHSDLILLDISKTDSSLNDLIMHLRNKVSQSAKLVGYSVTEGAVIKQDVGKNLDGFISRPVLNVEEFSQRIKELIAK